MIGDDDVAAVSGSGDQALYEKALDGLAPLAQGIASIGIAGGLAPALRVGQWVVADRVIADGRSIETDNRWTACIADRLDATRGAFLGHNAVVATAPEKAALHRATGALAVDMESHIAVRVAQRHRLPFVAARVICDPANRSLPPAAQIGMKQDGGMNLLGVFGSVLGRPIQVPALIAVALDAERAFNSLLRGRRRLGAGLGFPDLDKLALDVP